MPTMPSAIATSHQDLIDILRLRSRYCRYIDTKQWVRLRALFTADARFEGFGSAPDGADADTFVKGVSTRLGDCVSIHQCHTPDIAFQGTDQARGVWAMYDLLQWPRPIALKEAPEAAGFSGYGHYEESYRREAGVWKIEFVRLTRLRIDPLPAGSPPCIGSFRAASTDWVEALPH